MNYDLKFLTIEALIDLIDRNNVDLNPPYQRNFIWSPADQGDLIDTILNKWALPNFFLYRKPDGKFEMVDGQQRSKTIFRFAKGLIRSGKKFGQVFYKDIDQSSFLQYKLPFITITNIKTESTLRDFYVLINKKGKHLNSAEVQRSEFSEKKFMQLANEALTYQSFISLELFTEATSKRLNDREYVQELLGYLKSGIKDKKNHITSIFDRDIDEDEYIELKDKFERICDVFSDLNNEMPLKQTRYKQKNDFYTFFCFVDRNIDSSISLFKYQYKVLIVLDGKDGQGRQFIRPTNEDCSTLKKYAENCVTQSNSKHARDLRVKFFEDMLQNKTEEPNDELIDVLSYLAEIFGEEKIRLKKIESYYLLDVEYLSK